jgi:murein DD-endopeptidase MepM/ murein hydrolase activator NlpD
MKFCLIAFCSLIIIFAVSNLDSEKSGAQPVMASAFKVVLDGVEIGIIEDKSVADEVLRSVSYRLQRDLNKSMLIDQSLEYFVEYIEPDAFTSKEDLEEKLYAELMGRATGFRQKAYIIQIEDFKVAVETQEDVIKVFEAAQSKYDQRHEFSVELVTEDIEEEVLSVKVVKAETIPNELTFRAAAFSSAVEPTEIQTFGEGDDAEVQVTVEEVKVEEIPEVVEISFAEQVNIFSDYVLPAEVLSVEEAIEQITKENEKEKMYTVKQGDSLSVIAYNNEMKLNDLLKLNPELSEKTLLQIGQELVVTVPEPELSIVTKEKIVYTEAINRPTEYKDNADKYVGYSTVLEAGADGVQEVTALLNKVNGFEESKEIVEEIVLKEPVPKVVERGTKPLPSTAATGKYIRPIVGGTMSSPFGYRGREYHTGVDFATPIGTAVRASDGGKVTFAGWHVTYGYVIYIDHGNGVETRYAHLSKILVKSGQRVAQNEKIAETGNTGRSTGPHIHFEIRFDGTPANPMRYIN